MNASLEERVRKIEDYQAILDLKGRYCNACDGGWDRPSHDYELVTTLFTEDAVWDGRPGLPLAQGRDAIRSMMQKFREQLPFIIHHVMNPVINIDGDMATGHWHAIIHYQRSKGASTSFAVYEETYVRTDSGWRIQELRVRNTAHIHMREGTVTTEFVTQSAGQDR